MQHGDLGAGLVTLHDEAGAVGGGAACRADFRCLRRQRVDVEVAGDGERNERKDGEHG
mgnify:CR=1 FL=1